MSRYPDWVYQRPQGDRVEVQVEYPSSMTIGEVERHLYWSKSHWVNGGIYDVLSITASVKPHDLKHFEDENAEYITSNEFKVSCSNIEEQPTNKENK